MLAANARAQSSDQIAREIEEKERALAALPAGKFDWELHNGLRHLYGAVDKRKSMGHVEVILVNRRFDGYMKGVLGGFQVDDATMKRNLLAVVQEFPDLPTLSATLLIWSAELETEVATKRDLLERVRSVKNVDPFFVGRANESLRLDPAFRKPWPRIIPPPKGLERRPGPWNDVSDQTVWPNTVSRSNSDPWLAEHHDEIRVMRPRLLLINFSNEHSREHLKRLSEQLIYTLGEASRYHGYKDPTAPVFLEYQIFKYVDLRDSDATVGNSRKAPLKDATKRSGMNMQYGGFFSEEFADHYNVPDPRDPSRKLRLDELLDGGYVHEVWFFGTGNDKGAFLGALEVVEEKPRYDEKFQRIGNSWVQAGNGGDDDQAWCGRSCRIGFIDATRGIGCFMESLSHGMERCPVAIPYLKRYFDEYAGFDWRQRYKLPFDNLYGVTVEGQRYNDTFVTYPQQDKIVIKHGSESLTIDDYVAKGGSVHFPPNARKHYDLANPEPVLSTIEDWRIGSGENGQDIAKPFTNQAFRGYNDIAPDCMGPWLVYWRQNMPGLDNKQKDDSGKQMKNWWPFLFY